MNLGHRTGIDRLNPNHLLPDYYDLYQDCDRPEYQQRTVKKKRKSPPILEEIPEQVPQEESANGQ